MGQIGWGIAYVLFSMTFIPMILGLIEAFLTSGRVARFNEMAAQDVALRVKALVRVGSWPVALDRASARVIIGA